MLHLSPTTLENPVFISCEDLHFVCFCFFHHSQLHRDLWLNQEKVRSGSPQPHKVRHAVGMPHVATVVDSCCHASRRCHWTTLRTTRSRTDAVASLPSRHKSDGCFYSGGFMYVLVRPHRALTPANSAESLERRFWFICLFCCIMKDLK